MGKRKDLMDELDSLDFGDPRIPELQKKINDIEQWCIDNNPDWGVTVTNWNNRHGDSQLYPWHTGYVNYNDISMVGVLNETGMNINSDGTPHICSLCQ